MRNKTVSAEEQKKQLELKELKQSRKYCWFVRHFIPIQKKKIVFSQFGGNGYGCNPKAIAEEFMKRNKGYDLVWILKKSMDVKKAGIPEGIRAVKGRQSLYELLTARVWINNIHFNVLLNKGVVKRKKTIYLNTFHGGITLKSEGNDIRSGKRNKPLTLKGQMFRLDSEYVDYITSACDTEEHVLKEFFYGHGEVIKIGDARNDNVINGSPKIVEKVRKKYKIDPDTKIVLYAPTFRKDMKLHWYDLNYNQIIDMLEEKYQCKWVMIIRLHPRLASKTKSILPNSPKFINGGNYLDMQDLVIASDMMISDYSSCVTDFMLTRKPAFLYVPDIDVYEKQRGLYFSLEELPFPSAQTTEQLMHCMENFDNDNYVSKVNDFVKKIGYLDDGKASERIVDFLEGKMKAR